MRKILLVGMLSLAAHAGAQAAVQPFGLKQGMTIDQIKAIGGRPTTNPGYYRIDKVPSPNSSFEYYTVKASPKQGLCRVRGVGYSITNDSYGDKTRAAFDKLAEALNAKYGNSKHFDFLKVGSIWKDPRDWMMALYKDERYYSTYWDSEEKSNVPQGFSVSLDASGLSSDSGYVNLVYEFSNMKACTDEIDSTNNNGL